MDEPRKRVIKRKIKGTAYNSVENYFTQVPRSADSIQLPKVKNVARKSVKDIYLKDLQERISSTRQINEDSTDEIVENIQKNDESNQMSFVATIEQAPIELNEESINIEPIEHAHEPSGEAANENIAGNQKCSACVPLVRTKNCTKVTSKLIFNILSMVCSKRNTII